MKTYITLLLVTTLSLSLQQTAIAQKSIAPFTAQPISHLSATQDNSTSGFTIREENQKVFIDWTSTVNQDMNYFEVETSKDGHSYHLAGLVFASEKAASQDYTFFERAKGQKSFYRVRIIEKNGTVTYSPVLTAGAEKNKIN
jgi:hypothetical protein